MLPREKLEKTGINTLSNAELLAIILRTGTRSENIIELSNRLISEYIIGEAEFEFSFSEIAEKFKLSKLKSMQLQATFEIGKRLFKDSHRDKIILNSSKKVLNFYNNLLEEKTEKLFVALLNTRLKLISSKLIAAGSLNQLIIGPREVIAAALQVNAAGFILVHNHPSGDVEPSQEDIMFTRKLKQACDIVGVGFIDHLIIGKSKSDYYSFKKSGQIDT